MVRMSGIKAGWKGMMFMTKPGLVVPPIILATAL